MIVNFFIRNCSSIKSDYPTSLAVLQYVELQDLFRQDINCFPCSYWRSLLSGQQFERSDMLLYVMYIMFVKKAVAEHLDFLNSKQAVNCFDLIRHEQQYPEKCFFFFVSEGGQSQFDDAKLLLHKTRKNLVCILMYSARHTILKISQVS